MSRKPKSTASVESSSIDAKPPLYKRKWFIVVVVLLVLGTIGSFSGGGKTDELGRNVAKGTDALTISANTKYLEYSNKDIDPTTLVKANDKKAEVTAEGSINLKKVGTQSVVYKVAKDGEVSEQTVDFTVRDTKAPVIKLVEENPSIEAGGSYDPRAAIASVADEVDGDLSYVEVPLEAKATNAGVEDFYESGWYSLEGSINSSTPGTYPIKVTATDRHGNISTREISVKVSAPPQEAPAPAAAPTPAPAADVHTYVLNTNTKKFHLPGCSSIKQMKESNKAEVTATRDEVIANGYDPCGRCHP